MDASGMVGLCSSRETSKGKEATWCKSSHSRPGADPQYIRIHGMRKKDLETRKAIENILESSSPGKDLKDYFAGFPDRSIRRTISILSGIYPDKIMIGDEEFSFILYMFSDIKFMEKESFPAFLFSLNIPTFTDYQKELLGATIKYNIEILAISSSYELYSLLVNLLDKNNLLQYLEELVDIGTRTVLQSVSDLLLDKNFINSHGTDEKFETLKQKIATLFEIGHCPAKTPVQA